MEVVSKTVNLDTYNMLVENSAENFARTHKVKTEMLIHNKTGKAYFKIMPRFGAIIECTNGHEDEHRILYSDGVHLFTRELNEFNKKFSPYK